MTQAVGKWHCGENEESQPQNVGFDDFYGFLGWSGLYTDWQDEDFAPEFALSPERQAFVKEVPFNDHVVHGVKGQDVENLEADHDRAQRSNSTRCSRPTRRTSSRRWPTATSRSSSTTARAATTSRTTPTPSIKGKSPAKYPYKDCLIELDDIVGRLVKALEESGQLENTLIFITSDNGPMIEPWPDAGWTPFRGSIGCTWEGGVRVPGIVYWKGMITPGQQNDGLFDLSDLFLTSLALAGVEYRPPDDQYLDSIDQTSFLLADGGLSNRKYVYFWLQNIFSGLRVAEYKFMMAGMSFDELGRRQRGIARPCWRSYPNGRLFNLYLDPKERYSYFDRQTFMDAIFTEPIQSHKATFEKYPGKKAMFEAKIEEFILSR